MLVHDNANVTEGTIVNPDGSLAQRPTKILSKEDADLLRSYKKFLAREGLREALYCNTCWNGEREDGCRAHVTDAQIVVMCRCKTRFYQGQSF